MSASLDDVLTSIPTGTPGLFTCEVLDGWQAGRGALRRLVPRFGEAHLAAVGFVLFAAGFALLAVIPALGLLALATVASAIGNSMLRPCLTALVSQLADPREQGAVLGVTQAMSSIAAIAAPPLSGALIGANLGSAWAVLAAAICVLGFVLGLGVRRRPVT